MLKVKMIWEFRGPAAKRTAIHHEIHLKEYIKIEEVMFAETGVEHISEMASIAYLITNESEMEKIRRDLKPHRGQRYDEKS